jgi:hypothetical protein
MFNSWFVSGSTGVEPTCRFAYEDWDEFLLRDPCLSVPLILVLVFFWLFVLPAFVITKFASCCELSKLRGSESR